MSPSTFTGSTVYLTFDETYTSQSTPVINTSKKYECKYKTQLVDAFKVEPLKELLQDMVAEVGGAFPVNQKIQILKWFFHQRDDSSFHAVNLIVLTPLPNAVLSFNSFGFCLPLEENCGAAVALKVLMVKSRLDCYYLIYLDLDSEFLLSQ